MQKKRNTSEEYTKEIDALILSKDSDLLKDVPHEAVGGDLELVGGCRYERDGEWHIALYSNASAQDMQLTGEEITQAARRNLAKSEYSLQTINSAVGIPDQEGSGPRILVLTNREKFYGAAQVLNPKAMEDAAKRLDAKELYVIPSSVHETLLVSKEDCDRMGVTTENLDTIVQEVNAQELRPEEKLSDHVYAYDTARHHLYDPHDRNLAKANDNVEAYTAERSR